MNVLLTAVIVACGKKTEVKGVVYSRHNIPMPNVSIILQQYKSSDYPERTFKNVAVTNNIGEYTYNTKLPRRYSNELECKCDSGSAQRKKINIGIENTIDIYLK
ncbi:MAG: hypothetical protein H0U95_18560 [Bacteroidetes bacterium]|nr:hypothetical protein [Bacteroidota bacterium]